jgi:hypothetical protein
MWISQQIRTAIEVTDFSPSGVENWLNKQVEFSIINYGVFTEKAMRKKH